MKIQMIQDSKGKATGVFIPIKEWKQLKKQYSDLEDLEYKEAVIELSLIQKGKLKARSAKELLNEL
jgi:hypothetical protein